MMYRRGIARKIVRIAVSPLVLGMLSAAQIGCLTSPAAAQQERIERYAADTEAMVIQWRRDIHSHPELSNREFRTAGLVADHLRALGLDEVRTGIAHTGVVGILKGGLPGATVALRADMDALPVKERTDVPFASTVTAEYNGETVPVMHACGHDAHTAVLMGVAEVLAKMRDELPGTVMFIFQPAEEGPPPGEDGGATLMLEEGLFEGEVKPDAIFGLHVRPGDPGTIYYRSGPAMASSDSMEIVVRGSQTHGAMPWLGIDPITVSSQIVLALQTIPSRQLDITAGPVVLSVGSIHGGVRHNIIPDEVKMTGTIRTFDADVRDDMLKRIEKTVTTIAESAGASASVTFDPYAPPVDNDPELTKRFLSSLQKAAGADQVQETSLRMGAEDFAYYQRQVPGFYFHLGVNKEGVPTHEAAPNHSPYFYVNEAALITGVKALATLAVDFLHNPVTAER